MGQKSIIVAKAMTAAYVITILLLFAVSFAVYKMHLSDVVTAWIIDAIYVLSTLAGGLICAKAMNNRRIIWGVITAAAYFVLLVIISLILGGGDFKELIDVSKMAGFCLIGGIIGGILS